MIRSSLSLAVLLLLAPSRSRPAAVAASPACRRGPVGRPGRGAPSRGVAAREAAARPTRATSLVSGDLIAGLGTEAAATPASARRRSAKPARSRSTASSRPPRRPASSALSELRARLAPRSSSPARRGASWPRDIEAAVKTGLAGALRRRCARDSPGDRRRRACARGRARTDRRRQRRRISAMTPAQPPAPGAVVIRARQHGDAAEAVRVGGQLVETVEVVVPRRGDRARRDAGQGR